MENGAIRDIIVEANGRMAIMAYTVIDATEMGIWLQEPASPLFSDVRRTI